ncbi:MAG TPA: Xaa-Pro peptidase family protein [Anaerolineaceae bacterium]|nr:Xaa-Pro peptidase family protein [Anaerolineaceae bacterium]
MNKERLEKLNKLMERDQLDAVVLNPGFSFRYLTNLDFHLMERPIILLIPKNKSPHIILPALEVSRASKYFSEDQIHAYSDNPSTWSSFFQKILEEQKLVNCKIGVEAIRLRFLEYKLLNESLPTCNIVSADTLFSDFRIIKDQSEISSMMKAVQIAQNALTKTLEEPVIGKTEKELAAQLTINLLMQGSGEFPFPPIVAAGKNSADPHATPSDHIVRSGELLLFDWGASYEGYASDITRTFAVGDVDPIFYDIAKIVEEANIQGRTASKPGVTAGSIDKATRDIISKSGYAQYFTHRTGHGLGMDAHESPFIFTENEQLVEPGMVFTIEPGVYLPGKGGVRIEDNVVVTEDGALTLTDMPRNLKRIE